MSSLLIAGLDQSLPRWLPRVPGSLTRLGGFGGGPNCSDTPVIASVGRAPNGGAFFTASGGHRPAALLAEAATPNVGTRACGRRAADGNAGTDGAAASTARNRKADWADLLCQVSTLPWTGHRDIGNIDSLGTSTVCASSVGAASVGAASIGAGSSNGGGGGFGGGREGGGHGAGGSAEGPSKGAGSGSPGGHEALRHCKGRSSNIGGGDPGCGAGGGRGAGRRAGRGSGRSVADEGVADSVRAADAGGRACSSHGAGVAEAERVTQPAGAGAEAVSAREPAAVAEARPPFLYTSGFWKAMLDAVSTKNQMGDARHWDQMLLDAEKEHHMATLAADHAKSDYLIALENEFQSATAVSELTKMKESLASAAMLRLNKKKESLAFGDDCREQSRGGSGSAVCHAAEGRAKATPRKRPGYWKGYDRNPRDPDYWRIYGAQQSAKKRARKADQRSIEASKLRDQNMAACAGHEDSVVKTAAMDEAEVKRDTLLRKARADSK